MPWRMAQPAIFGLAILSFLLPFANVSCGTDQPSPGGGLLDVEAPDSSVEFKGYHFILGRAIPEDVESGFAIEEGTVEFGTEAFALVAALAAVAGLGLSLRLTHRWRDNGGFVAAVVGVVSLIVLGVSPTLESSGGFRVTWKWGYWVALLLFACALGVSYVLQEQERTPPAPPRPP